MGIIYSSFVMYIFLKLDPQDITKARYGKFARLHKETIDGLGNVEMPCH